MTIHSTLYMIKLGEYAQVPYVSGNCENEEALWAFM